jgi:hypothetical protein
MIVRRLAPLSLSAIAHPARREWDPVLCAVNPCHFSGVDITACRAAFDMYACVMWPPCGVSVVLDIGVSFPCCDCVAFATLLVSDLTGHISSLRAGW